MLKAKKKNEMKLKFMAWKSMSGEIFLFQMDHAGWHTTQEYIAMWFICRWRLVRLQNLRSREEMRERENIRKKKKCFAL